MERLFKILRSKFDRFEQTPPSDAFDNIMNSLNEDDKSKRTLFGGHGFLLFSSLIAVSTLASTFILNKSNFEFLLRENGKAHGYDKVFNVQSKSGISQEVTSNQNYSELISNQAIARVDRQLSQFYFWVNGPDGKAGHTSYDQQDFVSKVNSVTSNKKSAELLATLERRNTALKNNTSKSKEQSNNKKLGKTKRHSKKGVKIYKHVGKQKFEVKDPFSVYAQKSRSHRLIDSTELAEYEKEKKKEIEEDFAEMANTETIQPEYIKTFSRFEVSLVIEKSIYAKRLTLSTVETADHDLKNYYEQGSTSQKAVNVHYNINENLEFNLGVGHLSVNNTFQADRATDSIYVASINSVDSGSSISEETGLKTPLNFIGSNKLNYISIPFGIGYKQNLGKLKFYAGLGLRVNILLASKQQIEMKFKHNNETINQNNTKQLHKINSLNLALSPSLGVIYPINKRLDVSAATSSSLFLSDMYSNIYSLPILVGGQIGLRFKF